MKGYLLFSYSYRFRRVVFWGYFYQVFKKGINYFFKNNWLTNIALIALNRYNQIMDKRTEVKINNLIALRQLVTSVLVILISGVSGMLFLPNTSLKYILLTLGFYYIFVLLLNVSSVNRELNEYLYKED